MSTFRMEKDSMGFIKVPINQLWGAQTQRSLKFFSISTEIMPIQIIHALALIKKTIATVNAELGLLDKNKSQAIVIAADEILSDKHLNEFPLSIWQTGSGTQTNMNMNEVLANRASEILGGEIGLKRLVHPIDDVNKSQSSNDIFPTAMHIAVVMDLQKKLLPKLEKLYITLNQKSKMFQNIIKIGRTHLQDAIPITLGQEISGWASMINNNINNIKNNMLYLYELAVGGTAVGTGLNTHPQYTIKVINKIAKLTHVPFINSPNKFESLATCDALVRSHSSLKGLATSLIKIANDIRWLSSGPRCGIGEILIPENEPGSSIMPGKVNPTQCEALIMLCIQIFGNDINISMGGSSGNFELNVCKPMIIYNFLQSIRLLIDGVYSFTNYCVKGIQPNLKRINKLLHESLMLVTILNNHIGYDKATLIVQMAYKKDLTLKQATIKLGYLTEIEFDELIQPQKMINK